MVPDACNLRRQARSRWILNLRSAWATYIARPRLRKRKGKKGRRSRRMHWGRRKRKDRCMEGWGCLAQCWQNFANCLSCVRYSSVHSRFGFYYPPIYRDGNKAKARLINFLYPSSYYIAKVGLQARNPGSAACL